LKGIMAAKKKEIRRVTPTALTPRLEIVKLSTPSRGKQTKILGGSPADAAAELVRCLRDEARVL
jgi:electron transfer flavoprotein beta subunit